MDRPVPVWERCRAAGALQPAVGTGERYGDRTAPGGKAASAVTSIAPEHAGLVVVWLRLVAAVVNLNRSVAKVALPDIGKVAVADGCLLAHAPRPPVNALIAMVEQPTLSRGSCRGVVEAP